MVLSKSYTDFPCDEDLLDDLHQLYNIHLSEDEKTLFLTFGGEGIRTLGELGFDLKTFLENLNPFKSNIEVAKTIHERGCVWTNESLDGFNIYVDEDIIRHGMDDIILNAMWHKGEW